MEGDVTHARLDLPDRASRLIPLLRNEARSAEQQRRLTDTMLSALKDAGMLSMYKPRRHGGAQVSLSTAVETWAALGRGCGSTAWLMSQMNNTMLLVCQYFAAAALEDIFAEPEAYLASVYTGREVSARPVQGGYEVSGRWPYCSGCMHADWLFVMAAVAGAAPDAFPLMFAIPRSQVEIIEDWDVLGLCATGSNSVVLENVFVPASRAASMQAMMTGAPVASQFEGTLFRTAFVPLMLVGAAAPALGMAQAALDEFKEQFSDRPISFTTYGKRGEAAVAHMRFAEAAVKIDAAGRVLRGAAAEIDGFAARGEPMDMPDRLRMRMAATHTIRLCREAIDNIFDMSSTSALLMSNPLQRILRDVRALSAHAVYSFDMTLETQGRVMLGLQPNALLT
jgi:alkylation response protein AidB-like acyl-CoA dehydrogenase